MEDVTDITFRYICKHFGVDVMCSEFVASEALIRSIKKSTEKLIMFDYERPMAVQILGTITTQWSRRQRLQSHNPDFIDINFGCPVKKLQQKGQAQVCAHTRANG